MQYLKKNISNTPHAAKLKKYVEKRGEGVVLSTDLRWLKGTLSFHNLISYHLIGHRSMFGSWSAFQCVVRNVRICKGKHAQNVVHIRLCKFTMSKYSEWSLLRILNNDLAFSEHTFGVLQGHVCYRHLCSAIMCRVFLLVVCPVAIGDLHLLQGDKMDG